MVKIDSIPAAKRQKEEKKMRKSAAKILIYDIMVSILLIVVCIICKPGRQERVNTCNEIWTNGIETTGTMTRLKQKIMDTERTAFETRVRLEYEVEGMNYETECLVPKKAFRKLDTDKDGVAAVELRYDAAHPSRATVDAAVNGAKKTLTMTRVLFWIFLVLGVLEVLLLPVAIRLDMMTQVSSAGSRRN